MKNKLSKRKIRRFIVKTKKMWDSVPTEDKTMILIFSGVAFILGFKLAVLIFG